MENNDLTENYKYTGTDQLINTIQPKKIIEHFGGDISEIKKWADMSSSTELIHSIKAFEKEGYDQIVETLTESLNNK